MLVGASPKRKEDGRFVTGHGRYLDDLQLDGLLHLAVVRSPHAHARVLGVDAEAARALPGVVAVWTLGDLPELATATGAAPRAGAQGPDLHPSDPGRPPGASRRRGGGRGGGARSVRGRRRRRAGGGRLRAAGRRDLARGGHRARGPARERGVARQPGRRVHERQGQPGGGAGRRARRRLRPPGLPARGGHAARDARRAGRARSHQRRPDGVDVDPGAVRRAQRHRAGAPPARGAHPGDRARRGRRLRRQGPRLPRGDSRPRGGPAPRPSGEVGGDPHASTSSPPPATATRSTRRGSGSSATAASSRSRPPSRAITGPRPRWARPSR